MRESPLIAATDLLGVIDEPRVRIADCRFYLDRPAAGREAFADGTSRVPSTSHSMTICRPPMARVATRCPRLLISRLDWGSWGSATNTG